MLHDLAHGLASAQPCVPCICSESQAEALDSPLEVLQGELLRGLTMGWGVARWYSSVRHE